MAEEQRKGRWRALADDVREALTEGNEMRLSDYLRLGFRCGCAVVVFFAVVVAPLVLLLLAERLLPLLLRWLEG